MHSVAALTLLLGLGGAVAGPIDDFALRDCRGRDFRLGDLRERRVVVVVFLGVECPLARLYGPRLVELARTYEPRGVAFVGIDSNSQDAPSALAAYGKQHNIAFPLLCDPGAAVADRFGAERTPEVFVLDAQRVVRYRGRIDDQNDVQAHRARPTRNDLVDALDDLLAGRAVRQPRTTAPGCLIARDQKKKEGATTYCRDVAPILQRHCQSCHRPGEVGPLSLTSYTEAAGWAAMIREVVAEGRMPPWHANPKHGQFANDPSLSAQEKETLFRWIDTGCPEGNAADLPPPPRFVEGWNIGEPDVVLSMAEPFHVPAQGIIEYQFITIDQGAPVDRWVQAAEVRSSNRAVVHHCNVFLQAPNAPDVGEAGSLGSFCLAAMGPGTPPMVLPEGMAKRIPAGWRVVLVLHYTAIGSPQTDTTRLGLKLIEPCKVKKEVATKLMLDLDLSIPPGEPGHTVSHTWLVKQDVDLFAFMPHMHLRGKSFRYDAIYEDGREEVLLDVPRWDFNWQHRYVLATPKRLPAGTQIRSTAVYDNSASNPFNPDPTVEVHAGPQSWEEMYNGYFDFALADGQASRPSLGDCARAVGGALVRPPVVLLGLALCGLIVARRGRRI